MKTLLCCALTLLLFLPAAQAQYGHTGEDAPEIARLLNLAPQQSWIVFFCPDSDFCEAHVVCYLRGTPVALEPMAIGSKHAAKMNLFDALRNVGFTEAATRLRTDCEVRSEQDLDVRAYTRIGDAIVPAHEKTLSVNVRTGPRLPDVPEDEGSPLPTGYYSVWTQVGSDPGDRCGGQGDYDVGIIYARGGVLSGAHNELRLYGTLSTDGMMGGYYTDGFSGEEIGTFQGQIQSDTYAIGTWNSHAWGCVGIWGLFQ